MRLVQIVVIYLFIINIINAQEQELINSFRKLINWLNLNVDYLSNDCLLGLVIAEAQLNFVLERYSSVKNYKQIENLRNKCQDLIENVNFVRKVTNSNDEKLLNNILQIELWQQCPTTFINNTLNRTLKPFTFHSISNIFDGSPNETESDTCILELLEHNCKPSQQCKYIMSDYKTSHGYPLTHKLLYIQIANALRCQIDEDPFQLKIGRICSKILQEMSGIEQKLEDPSIIKDDDIVWYDLYLEQTVLCGTEGYTEFLRPNTERLLQNWQILIRGCFNNRISSNNKWLLKKCVNHFAGLIAASIALQLHYITYNNYQ